MAFFNFYTQCTFGECGFEAGVGVLIRFHGGIGRIWLDIDVFHKAVA